jgi:hypothetical protein
VNGNRPRDNNFLIESVDNNDQGLHGQAFQPENIEAVQEVTFLLDSFSAEYGRGGRCFEPCDQEWLKPVSWSGI